MNDDDKQPSYERLDETGQERNRRSFFDWLRGKEENETEEERLRKKLDEELKEAARQRAEQFEEERREEEQREVAETKKLKKRWRAKLVEKSKQLLDDVAAGGEEPTSGYAIAKLMVAERIVKLDAMLHDESLDLRRSEVKSLKINIDFMGLLSEKLDRPELEVPQEIDQLYQTIAASVEETTGEARPLTPEQTQEAAPVSENDAAYNAFAASIVHAIHRTLRPAPERPAASTPDGASSRSPETTPPEETIPESLLSTVKETALSGEAIRKELSEVDTARQLAEVVEKATILEEKPRRAARSLSYAGATIPIPEPIRASPVPAEHVETSPTKKIKYLSDLELFTFAQTVKLDSGRLLSDVYTKGEIDREGLIKVLEKFVKGEDFRTELTLRRESVRRRQESSQEYLPQPAVTSTPPARRPSDTLTPSRRALGRHGTSLAFESHASTSSQRPSSPQRERASSSSGFTEELQQRIKRRSPTAVAVVSVLLVVGLLIAVITLNIR